MKKGQHEHLFMMYPSETELLQFYNALPKRVQKRIHLHSNCCCLCLTKQDYEALKTQSWINEAQQEKQQVIVESNISFSLHTEDFTGSQITPWGVKRMRAPQVWDRTAGQTVKVGIIDTGVYAQHPDLQANVKGGMNTIDNTSPYRDENGHGTHVAGIIAASNNSFGVVGVAPSTELYSLKCFSPDGSADLIDIVAAIEWAIRHKIRVLNMSFGTREKSEVLRRAMQAALNAGIAMVASSGNTSQILDYPARFPQAVAIGALDRNNRIASFSNYGKTLNYVAPGVDILSTWPVPPGYNTLSGTSMSAPHITGLCALLLSQNPNLTPLELKKVLDRAARRLPRVPTLKQGQGYITATRALSTLTQATSNSSSLS